ncbi:MAG: 30S ribosomal protein S6 [Proteobacteria bacterium]|nr:30S ribosomal protein S6 [Pseudomonadota bacterium]MBU1711026.1 30S ribosomal protein S6 [Pseudomonadota bacterium]
MRRYETIFIIRPNVSEEGIDALIEKFSGIIQKFDGEAVNVDKWGMKKLAYHIKKERQGYYLYIEYASNPDAVNEIERISRIDDQVLKYITVKTQDVYEPGPIKGREKPASAIDITGDGSRTHDRDADDSSDSDE